MSEDPKIIAVFRPSLRVYLLRTAIAAIATLVPFLFGALYMEDPNVIYVGIALVLAFVFSFDVQRWLNQRQDYWTLTAESLTYSGQDGETVIPLPEIAAANRRLWWSVQLLVQDSQGINMSYLNSPADVAQQIMSTRRILLEAMP